ncbi:MAG TPA: ATP-binding protein [Streptosporangiaceae bacterium]|nr:ATP-binding protein [Streptosporangiaceae bacterium]
MTGAYPVLHVGSFGSPGAVRSTPPWTRTFRGVPASVPEARRFVTEVLRGCPARDALMTCASELCANAINHTDSGDGGVFIVEVDLPRPGVARIAVTDEGSDTLPAAGPADLMGEGGRGLALVAAYTTRWGYADAHPGRTVWAESCWPVPVPALAVPALAPPALAAPVPAAPARASRRPRPRITRSSSLPPDDRPPAPAA